MPILKARWLFGAAAVFNFCIGFGLLVARPLLGPLLRLDPIDGTNFVFVDLAGGLIALSGYAFVLLAINPDRYRPYVSLSIAGKLVGILSTTGPWLMGQAPWTLPALASGDLVFVVLFSLFLHQTSAGQPPAAGSTRA